MSGVVKIVLAALIWGTVGIVVRQADTVVPYIVFFRVLFAALTLAVVFEARRDGRPYYPQPHFWLLCAMGLFLACNWLLFFYAITLTTVASAVLAAYTAPVFIALLAPRLIGEKIELNVTLPALALASVGLIVVTLSGNRFNDSLNLVGVLCGVASGCFYALLIMTARYIGPSLSPLTITFWQSLVAAMVIAATGLFFRYPLPPLSSFPWLIVLGVVHTAFAFSLYVSGLRQVKAQFAGILALIEPISAVVFAALFLGEGFTVWTLVGGALILAAAALITLRQSAEIRGTTPRQTERVRTSPPRPLP